jgi:hypothetical protein
MRLVVCFVVLPLLPLVALFLSPSEDVPIVRDRIAVCVIAALVAAVISGVVASRAGWRPASVLLCSLTTGALTIVPIAVWIVTIFETECGGGDGSC